MNYLIATVMLGFIAFINLIMAIAMNLIYSNLKIVLWDASNITNVSTKTMPLINQIEILFWILFLFSAVAAIVWYVIGSHTDEHESYEDPRQRF